jgi:hypothetical protein
MSLGPKTTMNIAVAYCHLVGFVGVKEEVSSSCSGRGAKNNDE